MVEVWGIEEGSIAYATVYVPTQDKDIGPRV